MRLKPAILLAPLVLLAASDLRAEYFVLRTGMRLHVTGYQLLGDKYRLQLAGGWVDVKTDDVASIEPEDVFKPIPAPPAAVAPASTAAASPFHELVAAAASRYGVDAELISSVMAVESNFDPKAVSRKNARGLMQLLPETAARLGVKDIFDPQENIDAGTRYLKELLQKYNNDLVLTLAAYNAGPDNVQKYGAVPPFNETISYVKRVKRNYEKSKASAPTAPSAPGPNGAAPNAPAPTAPGQTPPAQAKPATPKTTATDPPTPPSPQAAPPTPPSPQADHPTPPSPQAQQN
jgi:transglycosylase-like protein with SLT domain